MKRISPDAPAPGNRASWLIVSLLAALAVGVLFGFQVLRRTTFLHYPYDRPIALGYVAIVAAIAAVAWFTRGRALLFASASVLVAATAIPCIGSGFWKPLLAFCWIFCVASGLGRRVLRTIAPSARFRCLDEWILSAGAGYGAYALVILIAGSAFGVGERALLGIQLVATLAAGRDFAALVRRAQHRLQAMRLHSASEAHEADRRSFAAFVALMSLCAFGSWMWTLVPPNDYDGLMYHVGAPSAYLANGSFYLQVERSHAVLAKNPSMLYLMGLGLGGAVTPKVLHFSCALLTPALAYAAGRRLSSARTGLIAALLFFSMPLVTWEGGSTFIDLFATLFVFGSFWSILTWRDRGWNAAVRIAGLFAGFAIGTKVTTVAFILPELVVLAVMTFRDPRKSIGLFLQFGVVAFLAILPWCVRDYLWTGNPVFPLLNGIFKSPLWPVPESFWTMYGNDTTLLNFLLVPLRLHFDPLLYCEDLKFGAFAGLTILCWPIFLAFMNSQTKRQIGVMATYSVLSTAIWFVSIQYTRYLLPLMPVLALMAALNWQAGIERLSAAPRKWYLRTSIAFGIALIVLTRWVNAGTNNDSPTRYPVLAALGMTSQDDFLRDTLREYRALTTLAREIPGRSSKVLSVGTELRFYSKDVPIFEVSGWAHAPAKWRNEILAAAPGPDLSAALGKHGFGYLLVSGAWLDSCTSAQVAPVASVVDHGFLNRRCEFVGGGGQDLIYRVLDDAHCGPPVLGPNLVRSADFQAESAESAKREGALTKDDASRRSLAYGKGTTLIDEPVGIEGTFSVEKKKLVARAYPVEGGKRYCLKLKCRCDDPEGASAAEVQFFAGSRHLHTERRLIKDASDWKEFDMHVEADARATTARIVVTASRHAPSSFGEIFFAEYLGHGGKDPSNGRPALAEARQESAQR